MSELGIHRRRARASAGNDHADRIEFRGFRHTVTRGLGVNMRDLRGAKIAIFGMLGFAPSC
jgi:hypothetical protein